MVKPKSRGLAFLLAKKNREIKLRTSSIFWFIKRFYLKGFGLTVLHCIIFIYDKCVQVEEVVEILEQNECVELNRPITI